MKKKAEHEERQNSRWKRKQTNKKPIRQRIIVGRTDATAATSIIIPITSTTKPAGITTHMTFFIVKTLSDFLVSNFSAKT